MTRARAWLLLVIDALILAGFDLIAHLVNRDPRST